MWCVNVGEYMVFGSIVGSDYNIYYYIYYIYYYIYYIYYYIYYMSPR